MQHDGKIETCPFRRPFFTKKNEGREQLLHNNHKNGSRTKDFNKKSDTSNTSLPQAIIACNKPKLNSVRFEDPYDHINPMENNYDKTHILDTHI